MAQAVAMGAVLQCSCGMTPSTMIVTPENKVMQNTPMANIMDHIPFKNILPFGLCNSLANPAVAAATAAAFGVLTPMPCVPSIPAPWIPSAPTVLLANKPILTDSCKVMCMWAGVISVTSPGQIPVQVKG
ncbi:DUF4280 domain-containing protein [Vibrio spartinae]|uniref:DUF4280 domain-containing protein n=1 Tax=Vibrio spartinae TaxID=1918945 RepID=A0ABX6QZ91_9VIBR|nr:DUF4280 domain-containing protein [Vibrio spartinae]QMV14483.1 hypothetical protein Vspart_01739 [Vibrio spartinae]